MTTTGVLKARLAKLRSQLLEVPKGQGGPGDGFDVKKFGDARVALIGFPRYFYNGPGLTGLFF